MADPLLDLSSIDRKLGNNQPVFDFLSPENEQSRFASSQLDKGVVCGRVRYPGTGVDEVFPLIYEGVMSMAKDQKLAIFASDLVKGPFFYDLQFFLLEPFLRPVIEAPLCPLELRLQMLGEDGIMQVGKLPGQIYP